MEQITIRDENGSTLDAKVEVGGGEIVAAALVLALAIQITDRLWKLF